MENPLRLSIILTGVVFLCIGYARGVVTEKNVVTSSLQTLTIDAIAALISYSVGFLLHTYIGV